jgi:hypothetical protein
VKLNNKQGYSIMEKEKYDNPYGYLFIDADGRVFKELEKARERSLYVYVICDGERPCNMVPFDGYFQDGRTFERGRDVSEYRYIIYEDWLGYDEFNRPAKMSRELSGVEYKTEWEAEARCKELKKMYPDSYFAVVSELVPNWHYDDPNNKTRREIHKE